MYCSSCGSAVQGSLSYCNRCGAKVVGAELDAVRKSSELPANSILTAILVVFVFGLAAVFGLMSLMKGPNPIIIVAALLCFVLTFLIEVVLFWLLLRGRRDARVADAASRPNEQTTRELAEAQARQLAEPPPSVTEHTTRTFEPVYGERKSK